jgi:hypothetical protein
MKRLSIKQLTAGVFLMEGLLVVVALIVTKIWTVTTPWLRWASYAVLIVYVAALISKIGGQRL